MITLLHTCSSDNYMYCIIHAMCTESYEIFGRLMQLYLITFCYGRISFYCEENLTYYLL